MIIETLDMQIRSQDFSEANAVERSPGLHLGSIISSLDEARNGGRKRYPDMDEATRQAYFTMGFIWEQLLTGVFRDTAIRRSEGNLVRPGELRLGGIAMSPDAIDLTDYALEEYKCTYLSAARPIEDPCFWPWVIQMKCYCKAAGTRLARLRVFFVVGDWKGSGPQVKAWQFRFTDRDVEEAFSMCANHARAKGWL